MIHAHLDDRHLCPAVKAQNRPRHADVIVEIGLRPERAEFLRQHGIDHILHRGLADAARHRDDRDGKTAPVRPRQISGREQRVRHLHIKLPRHIFLRLPGHDRSRSACRECRLHEPVSVRLFSPERKEYIARFNFAVVALRSCDQRILHAEVSQQLPADRLPQLLQCYRLHPALLSQNMSSVLRLRRTYASRAESVTWLVCHMVSPSRG